MIRLSWRQFRTQGLIAAVALAAVAVLARITGAHLVSLYNAMMTACKAQGDCGAATSAFAGRDQIIQSALNGIVLFVPAVVGVFWGAPLVARELETGTFRLAWTQSVTRSRWMAVKIGLVGVASIVTAAVFSLVATWWFSPIDRIQANRFSPAMFSARGIVPIGYAAFAFALGLTAGLLFRRTLPAIAATLVGFVGARVAMILWLRPHLMAPAHTTLPVSAASGLGFGPALSGSGVRFIASNPRIPNAWVYSVRVLDSAGHAITSRFIQTACPAIASTPIDGGQGPPNPALFQACIGKISSAYHLALTYQPASRYWTFQWYEAAIFFAVGVALCGFSIRWIRRT